MPRKRGPKTPETYDAETLRTCSVMLDDMAVRRLKVLGGGNLSVGARRAARVAYDLWQRQEDVNPTNTRSAARGEAELQAPPPAPAA